MRWVKPLTAFTVLEDRDYSNKCALQVCCIDVQKPGVDGKAALLSVLEVRIFRVLKGRTLTFPSMCIQGTRAAWNCNKEQWVSLEAHSSATHWQAFTAFIVSQTCDYFRYDLKIASWKANDFKICWPPAGDSNCPSEVGMSQHSSSLRHSARLPPPNCWGGAVSSENPQSVPSHQSDPTCDRSSLVDQHK